MQFEAIIARYKKSPIIVHASVLLALVYFIAKYNLADGTIMFTCFMLLLLAHELGHAYYAKKQGYFVSEIKLFAIWGHCKFSYPTNEYVPAIVHAGGLIVQTIILTFATSVYGLLKLNGSEQFLITLNPFFEVFIFYNLYFLVLNSLPIPGLDGYELMPYVKRLFTRNKSNIKQKPKTRFYKPGQPNKKNDNNVVDMAKMRERKNKKK